MSKDQIVAPTPLTVGQRKELLALGTSMADIRALQEEGLEFDAIKLLCEAEQAAKDAETQKDADRQAKANKRALRPENEAHPGISVYSHPEGDVARPRELFACKTYWAGGECEHDTSTAEEIALLNKLQPGRYLCLKGDGSKIAVDVVAVTDPVTGRLEAKRVNFGKSREDKDNLMPQVVMLREMIAMGPKGVAA